MGVLQKGAELQTKSQEEFEEVFKRRLMTGYSSGSTDVKSIPPTENWLRKRHKYSIKNDKSTEDKHETNHINNKYNDMNMNTRKMHNT